MTAEEFEAQLRIDNPLIDGESSGDDYEATIAKWVAAWQSQQDPRGEQRAQMRTDWDALPAWLRGPYRPVFDAANQLLDENDDEAAMAMIEAAEPNAIISADAVKLATFQQVKQSFSDAVEALP